MADFVNPYTFIPLPASVQREATNGHDRLTHLAGSLRVTLTAATPLIIREGDEPQHARVPQKRGRVLLAGSSLHGAVRSMHETLAGGCLRVIDPGYVPGYRQEAEDGLDDLTMAVVESVDATGRAETVRLCESATWVDAAAIHTVLGPVDAGERVYIREKLLLDDSRWRRNRYEIHAELVQGDQTWISRNDGPQMAHPAVVFITDTNARPRAHGHYWAVAQPTEEVVRVGSAAWDGYLAAAAGSEDLRISRQPQPERLILKPVRRNNVDYGRRYPTSLKVWRGQPLWVRVEGAGDGSEVTEIRLAQVWRRPGGRRLRDRIPADLLPCSDRGQHGGALVLCPSCQIFGSAEEREPGRVETDRSVQLSYAGHVSVGDATSVRPVAEVLEHETRLAPLMGPHPGAGHFYLDPPAPAFHGVTEWGGPADAAGQPSRAIRGRKFYWRTTPDGGEVRPRRAVPRGMQNTTRSWPVLPVRIGTAFTVDVQFTNLTPRQLGGLIVAFQPALLFAGAVLSVGGGKPFGFGAMMAEVEITNAYAAAERYAGHEPPDRRRLKDEAVAAFLAWRHDLGTLQAVDAAARHVLQLDFVADDLVSYPFDDQQRHAADPHPGYRFFRKARGGSAGNAPHPLPLPDPAGAATHQVLDSGYGTGQ